jgi:phenylalanyl-tRNA synthetase beta chain
MKISVAWLKEFLEIPDETSVLAQKVTAVGLAVESVETAGTETLFELEVTTNRPDCMNHLGVAREVSAIYGTPLRKPAFNLRETGRATEEVVSISIAESDLCGRYCGRYIAGVKIGPSPDWLKQRLEAIGVRSINNVADVTNYVLMELGQPLHSFDADTLRGHQIVVRRAELDETLTTLDGVERKLDPSTLVIADANRAVAVAGVMGGADTEISASTTNVLLESAYFNPLSIRKASRALALSTEASYRFERGADIEMARFACDRAAVMIQELAGGEIYRGVIDVYPKERTPINAILRRERIESFLGSQVDDATVERILKGLEFKVSHASEGWSVAVPSFRVDVTREEDLLEEIARQHGYDKFPATLPSWSGAGAALPLESQERLLRNVLSGNGYTETIGLAFAKEETERKFSPTNPVKLSNPMAEDQSVLRTSMVPSILRAIEWNLNRGARNLQLYELGKVYTPGSEIRALIFAATGTLRAKSVHEQKRDFNFYDLKGDVEQILQTFDLDKDVETSRLPAHYHPGRSARIGETVVFGELHPEYAELFKLRQRVYLAEVAVDTVLSSQKRRLAQLIPKFPSIRRDLSVLLEKGTRYADIHRAILSAGIRELVRVEPFDKLESGSFPETKYSLSITLIYQSDERTLTDTEVEAFDKQILQLMETRLGAHLRM